MRSSKELLEDGGSALLKRSSKQSQKETEHAQRATDWVWRKMTEMYGAQWVRERGKAPPTTWTLAIGKHDADTIRHAMARVPTRHPDWPPTLPQFMACCTPQPKDYGAPSAEAAWHEARSHAMQATSHQWSHDAVRLTGRRIGWGDIHRATDGYAKEVKKDFLIEYGKAVEAMAGGLELLEFDGDQSSSLAAQLASEEEARQKAADYDGINGPQALRLMRAMTGRKEGDDE